jgi:pimeloyl-ACP methyl ester carboxylesterase
VRHGEALILAAEHPERVAGLVLIAPALPVREREVPPYPFDEVLDTDEGWAKENRHYWLRDWRGYLGWFFARCFTEPHSTKQIEDCVGWGLDTDAGTILAGFRGWADKELDPETVVELCGRVRCPTLVIQGTEDELVDPEWGGALAEQLGAPLVMLEGTGHGPHARDPVKVNTMVASFAGIVPAPASRTWTRASTGPSGPCTCPRPSGWATPAGTWPSPGSCGRWSRAWRSTGWPRTP